MITFSEDDEAFLDRVTSPPVTPPLPEDEEIESTKALWYHDKSSHDQTVSISLSHSKRCFSAGDTIEVDATCTARNLQLLSGVLEGFCVINGHVEESFVFHEVRLFPQKQLHTSLELKPPETGRKKLTSSGDGGKHFKFCVTLPHNAPPSIKISSKTGIFYRIRVCGIGGMNCYFNLASIY